jgi:hypothetical protein
MFADFFMALRRGVDQLTYWCHTYLPLNRWRRRTDEVLTATAEEGKRYELDKITVDRRRAYQVARMTVTNRRGEHLSDLLPDAYWVFSPTSCAKTQSGKKKFKTLSERRDGFRGHPQTLAYLMAPSGLARSGIGASLPGTLMGVGLQEPTPPAGVIANRIREELSGGGEGAVDQYAQIIARLHAGPPVVQTETEAPANAPAEAEASG